MRFVILLLLVGLLQGCSMFKPTPPKKEIIYVYRVPQMPQTLLSPCEIPRPPIKEKYVSMPPYEREKALTVLTVNLYKNLSKCNIKIKSIKKWYTTHKKGEDDAK